MIFFLKCVWRSVCTTQWDRVVMAFVPSLSSCEGGEEILASFFNKPYNNVDWNAWFVFYYKNSLGASLILVKRQKIWEVKQQTRQIFFLGIMDQEQGVINRGKHIVPLLIIFPDLSVYCFPKKALAVTKEVNCVRHFIPECESFLQQLKNQKEKGLLYGVPVSIKDHIAYKVIPLL